MQNEDDLRGLAKVMDFMRTEADYPADHGKCGGTWPVRACGKNCAPYLCGGRQAENSHNQ